MNPPTVYWTQITDAEPPYLSRGCPFQAWSLGEALRLDRIVLAVNESEQPRRKRELAMV
jgi:glycogen debranching enzyme